MKKSGITALLLAAITFTGTVHAQVGPPPFTPGAYLKANNTGPVDLFGTSVAISGNTAVVGAPEEDSAATNVNGNGADNTAQDAGAAYVYVKTGDTWTFQAYLKPRNAEAGDRFGESVAIFGDLIVVGAPQEDSNATGVNGSRNDNTAQDSGAAYVFRRSGTSWSQRAYLKASNTDANDRFGSSVSISGNTVVVGAVFEDSSDSTIDGNQLDNTASRAGAAYVFSRTAGVWAQQSYLKADNIEANDQFGTSVAVDGDTIVVSSLLEDSASTGVGADGLNNNATDSGAAYVFFRVGGVWSQQAYLKASNTESQDQFGKAVAISRDTIVVGNPFDASDSNGINADDQNNNALKAGSAYVFVRNINVWSQQAYLKASNANGNDQFGGAVSVSGDSIIVGAIGEDSGAKGVNGNQQHNSVASSGAAYVYVRSGTTWTQRGYLKASNTEFNDTFGHAVGVSGNNAIVTAESEDGAGLEVTGDPDDNSANQSGAAYTYNVPIALEPAVIIRTIAGNGSSLADNVPASEAQFAGVLGLTIDTADNLFLSEPEGHRVRVIDATNGIITTIAGTGSAGFGGDGAAGPSALLSTPIGVSYDDNLKRIVISDSVNERIRAFNLLNGQVNTIGGTGTNGQSGDGGPALSAEISTPSGIVAHPDGSIYFSTASNTVRRIDPAGNISTVAGNGTNGFSGDLGPATDAMLNTPTGLAFDQFANLFIADSGNHRIRRVDAQTGIITTFAGTGVENFSGDLGLAVDAQLDTPGYLAFAANGDLYFTDSGNHVIRYIERDSKVIHTFAGTARKAGFTGDGGSPLLARLDGPAGLVFDSIGNLYVADRNNQRIRKIEQLPLSVFNFQNLLPGDSIPLFTNNHLFHFEAGNGGQVEWQLAASNVLEVAGNRHIVTKREFNAFHLHAEFRLPNDGSSGNSGIYLQDRYEIQIFNSFGKPVLDNNDCGAIWGRTPPPVNACLAPGVWQSLEITFHPAQWNNATNKVSNARVTVALNGTLLHDNVEITSPTSGAGLTETNTPGPLRFQELNSPVQFRNIVITPFDTAPRFEWVRAAGSTNAFGGGQIDEAASGISSDRMGNVYVAGGFVGQTDFGGTNVLQSAGATDAFLAKYSSAGDLQWVVRGGGPGVDRFTDVDVAPDGTVVVSGSTETNAVYSGNSFPGAGSSDVLVAKYAADGSLVWIRTVGASAQDQAHAVAVDAAGDIFVTGLFRGTNFYPNGTFISSAFGSRDAFISRYRPDGTVVWARSGGGLLTDSGNDVVPDGAGGAYFAGAVGSSAIFGPIVVAGAGNEEAFAAHIDANGFYRWFTNSTTFGNNQHAQSIARGPNGDLYISGPFQGSFQFGGNTLTDTGQPATHDIFLAQISPLGRPGWIRQVAGDGDDGQANTRLATDQQGGIYLSGAIGGDTKFSSISVTTNGNDDIFLAKYAPNGDVEWARSARGFGRDSASTVDVAPSGHIVLGGFFSAVANFDGTGLTSRGGLDIFTGRLGSTLSQLPVSQWRFDDTNSPAVIDSFGAFNGMLSSTGAVYTGGGFATNAVFFNSTNNGYVNFGNVPLTGLDPLTISMAIKIDENEANHMVVLSKHDTNFNRGLVLGVNGLGTNDAPGKVFFTDTGRFQDAIVSQVNVVDGRWHSVVITYQPYGLKTLYVDGVQQAFGSANLFPPVDAPLLAGGISAGGVPIGMYDGLIDELVIYRRVLSAEEIEVQSIYPDEQIRPFAVDAFEWLRQAYATNIVANAVATDGNGDIYVVGSFQGTANFGGTNVVTSSFFSTDAFVAKYNSQGDLLWLRTGTGSGDNESMDVAVDSQGLIVVGGNYESTVSFGGLFLNAGFQAFDTGFLAKYSPDGTILRLLDGWGNVSSVAVDSNNNMYVAGTGFLRTARNNILLQTPGAANRDMWLAKFDFVGNVQWARNFGGTGNDGIDTMSIDDNGNIYVSGEFESGSFNVAGTTLFQNPAPGTGNSETFVIRIDPGVGDPVWASQGFGVFEQINDSLFDTQGRFNLAGAHFNNLSFGSVGFVYSGFSGFRALFSTIGQPLLGQSYFEEIKGMATSSTNNVYIFGELNGSNSVNVAGQLLSSRGNSDAFLLKINDDGTNQFVRQIGGQGTDRATRGNSVSIDLSGNVYIVGSSDPNNGAPIQFENLASVPNTNSSMWLVKAPSEVQILRQPTDLVATNLDSTFFRVLPGGTHPFVYQWYFNGTNPIPSGTNALLRLDTLALIQEGQYHVEVSNVNGRAVSDPANLTVALPPIIVSEPADRSAGLNRSSIFEVIVGGIGPFTYQWFFNGQAITNATNASYTVSNISTNNEGFYNASIVNQFGTVVSSAAELTTFPAGILPEVLTQPISSTNAVGSFVSFDVTTGGQHPLFYQWLKDGVPLAGRTQPFLQLFDLQLADAGNYSVFITNVFGTTTSSNAFLSVFVPQAPAITVQPMGQTVSVGANVTFNVVATGSPVLRYQWLFNNSVIADATNSTFSIPAVSLASAGNYRVQVFNDAPGGLATSVNAPLVVHQVPFMITQPQSINPSNQQPAMILSSVGGFPTPAIQWFRDGAALTNGTDYLGVDAQNLSVLSAGVEDVGTYFLIASNAAGAVTSAPASLVLNFPAQILVEPVSANIPVGTNHTLSISVTGAPPVSVQWFRNGQPIVGANMVDLVITNATRTNTGIYHAFVNNASGSQTSSNATLRVLVPQRLLSPVLNNDRFEFFFGESDGSLLEQTSLPPLTVEFTTNFNGWFSPTNLPVFTNGQLYFQDILPPALRRRYYRVIEQGN